MTQETGKKTWIAYDPNDPKTLKDVRQKLDASQFFEKPERFAFKKGVSLDDFRRSIEERVGEALSSKERRDQGIVSQKNLRYSFSAPASLQGRRQRAFVDG